MAPISPPIKACEEELGSPSRQVNRFQTIAPISAAPTIRQRDRAGLHDPFTDRRGDRRGEEGAGQVEDSRHQQCAARRERRVEIGVAMALAASWKPLVKSNSERDGDDQRDREAATHS